MDNRASSSHKQILKSTGIIGGEQVINILAGVARSKAVARLEVIAKSERWQSGRLHRS